MRQGVERGGGRQGLVTASEIASYVYCPEQWRLEWAQGLEPGNRPALDAGARHHGRTAVAERIAGAAIALGRWLAVLAVLALVLLGVLSRW